MICICDRLRVVYYHLLTEALYLGGRCGCERHGATGARARHQQRRSSRHIFCSYVFSCIIASESRSHRARPDSSRPFQQRPPLKYALKTMKFNRSFANEDKWIENSNHLLCCIMNDQLIMCFRLNFQEDNGRTIMVFISVHARPAGRRSTRECWRERRG